MPSRDRRLRFTLQHTATQCSALQYTAAHCNTLQHTATRYNTLQHNATHCSTLQHTAHIHTQPTNCLREIVMGGSHWNTLQHAATHCNSSPKCDRANRMNCNTLQHTAALYNALQRTASHWNALQQTAAHSQHTATHCNTLAAHWNILQHSQQRARVPPGEHPKDYLSLPQWLDQRAGSPSVCVHVCDCVFVCLCVCM